MEVFLNGALLVVIQDFIPTHRLARTCKSIKKARDDYKRNIEYTLTLAGTQKYLRSAEFREEIGKLIPDPGTQLELRCEIDDCYDVKSEIDSKTGSESRRGRASRSKSGKDAGGALASPGASAQERPLVVASEYQRTSGPLTRDMYFNVVKKVRGFQICVYTKSVPDCLQFIDDWEKVTCFDGPRFLFYYFLFQWKLATNMTRLGLIITCPEDLNILDDVPSVTYLRLNVHDLVAPDLPRTNFSKLERLVIAGQCSIDFKNFGVLPRLRTLVVGFHMHSEGEHNVMKNIHENCPNVVSLGVSFLPAADLSGIGSLTKLRTLVINEESIGSLPVLGFLTKLCVRDSRNIFFFKNREDDYAANTADIVRALNNKRSCLPSLEEITLECAIVTDFAFLDVFPSLTTLRIIKHCRRTMYSAFFPRVDIKFELAEIRGNVRVFTGAVGERQFAADIEDF